MFGLLRTTTRTLQKQQQLAVVVVRDYAFKSDLKIKWVRPEKISCIKPEKSGDQGKLPELKPTDYMWEFRDSKELLSAEPEVQKLFQLGFNQDKFTSKYQRDLMVKEVQRHSLDYGSMESRIAKLTATIRSFQERMEQFPRNRASKVLLKEMIDRRKKFLKYLRRWDYPRFEWILEKLDLVYKPPPAHFHWVTRKESLQKLTKLYERKIKTERLEKFREQLEDQKIPFLENAIKKLEMVRQEQIDCDLPITITDEHIQDYKTELEKTKLIQAAAKQTVTQSENTI